MSDQGVELQAQRLAAALQRGIDFMEGFEDDASQETVTQALRDMRDALAQYGKASGMLPEVGTIGLHLEGGVVQSVWADRPIDVVVLDYDTGNSDEDDLFDMPQADGGSELCFVHEFRATLMPEECVLINKVLDARDAANLGDGAEHTQEHVEAGIRALRPDWFENFADDAISDAAEAAQAQHGTLASVTAVSALETAIREAAVVQLDELGMNRPPEPGSEQEMVALAERAGLDIVPDVQPNKTLWGWGDEHGNGGAGFDSAFDAALSGMQSKYLETWQYEIANGDTRRGFVDYVQAALDAAEHEEEAHMGMRP